MPTYNMVCQLLSKISAVSWFGFALAFMPGQHLKDNAFYAGDR